MTSQIGGIILITNFLRAAKTLTNNDWKILTERILNNDLDLNPKEDLSKC